MCNKGTDSLSLFLKIIYNQLWTSHVFILESLNKNIAHHVFLKVLERKSLMCVTWIDFPPYFTMNHKPTHSHCLSECFVPNCVSLHFAYHTDNFHICNVHGPEQRSQYSDSLQAGQSDGRTTVTARFSAPVQSGPGANPAYCTMSTGSFFSQG